MDNSNPVKIVQSIIFDKAIFPRVNIQSVMIVNSEKHISITFYAKSLICCEKKNAFENAVGKKAVIFSRR